MDDRNLVLPGLAMDFDPLDEVAESYEKWNRGKPKNRGAGITRGSFSDKHANKKKHKGVSLADAEAVFYDDAALTIQDRDHDEDRWVTMGKSATGQILVVAYTYRDPNFIRIISARLASRTECRHYLEG